MIGFIILTPVIVVMTIVIIYLLLNPKCEEITCDCGYAKFKTKKELESAAYVFGEQLENSIPIYLSKYGPVSEWNVSNITDMSNLFNNYEFRDPQFDISKWDVSNVTNMSGMFRSAVNHLDDKLVMDLSSWNVSNVRDMSDMFRKAVDINPNIESWNVSSLSTAKDMFNGAVGFNRNLNKWTGTSCNNLTASQVKGMFDTNLIRGVNPLIPLWFWRLFLKDSVMDFPPWLELEEYPYSKLKIKSLLITDGSSYFRDKSELEDAVIALGVATDGSQAGNVVSDQLVKVYGDISDWDVSRITDMRSLFYARNLRGKDLSKWDVGNVTDMSEMFMGATGIDNININDWDVGNVEDMHGMFRMDVGPDNNATVRLNNLDIKYWNVSKVTDYSYMFFGVEEAPDLIPIHASLEAAYECMFIPMCNRL